MSYLAQHRRRHGFTLVELLVVIFIIAILSTLILAAVHMAQRSSRISRTKLGMAAISSALEQYHNDFKVYPSLPTPPGGSTQYTILAQALIGPGDKTEDGADGPGFRIPDPSTGQFNANSKKWDAYLSPERFKTQRFARGWALLDSFDNPIRYYPKRKALNSKTSIPPDAGIINGSASNPQFNPKIAIFDARDGEHPEFGYPLASETNGQALSGQSLAKFLGDDNGNNFIDGAESLLCEANFILASPGPNGRFTDVASEPKLSKSDDIFNFER